MTHGHSLVNLFFTFPVTSHHKCFSNTRFRQKHLFQESEM